jgi:tetratricopeptide (TPR) repeat protein
MKKQVIYILALVFSTFLVAQNSSVFEEANALYNTGEYTIAIEKYKSIIAKNQHSAEIYFNLGNAHYKLNNIAPSIFYYEKALQLSPNDKDIKNNIAFAKNMTIDSIDTIPEVGFSKVINSIINSMSFDAWAKLTVALIFLFVILILMYYFSYRTTQKRLAFVGGFIVLFLCLIALTFSFQKFSIDKNNKHAIVFIQESRVKSEPNLRSEEAFRLHEGTKVKILDTINDWKKIKLSDGKIGWIRNDDIKEL